MSQLGKCHLSYPALKPLVEFLGGKDDIAYARFYSAPQLWDPHKRNWHAFRSANRHVEKLSFFMGYRNEDNGEKAIDVALAVDLIYGCAHKEFDRAVVVGGDGDHIYALDVARKLCPRISVWMMPDQPSSALRAAGFSVRNLDVPILLQRQICERGADGPVPNAHRAPPGSPDITPMYTGAFGKLV